MVDETVGYSIKDGRKFFDVLRSRGIHCGIKVDAFLVVIGGTNDEIAYTGLDGLGKDALNITKKDADSKN